MSTHYLTQPERRALEERVARLPVQEADAVVERGLSDPKWARDNGWTRPAEPVGTARERAEVAR